MRARVTSKAIFLGLRLLFGIVVVLGLQQRAIAQDSAITPSEIDSTPVVKSSDSVSSKWNKEEFWNGWRSLPSRLIQDQKQIYTFPRFVLTKRNLKPTLAIVGVTAGLIALDRHPAQYFQKTKSFGTFNKI